MFHLKISEKLGQVGHGYIVNRIVGWAYGSL